MPEPGMVRRRIRVTGTVQGVGFRPFVYRLAAELKLVGWVCNDSQGVLIEAEGTGDSLDRLERCLSDESPPLARVGSVEVIEVPVGGEQGFKIVVSAIAGAPTAPVGVDTATCERCMAEVNDPTDRRYRYPFTNCTDCGPRYTIVKSVPYDRPGTTMAGFTMCRECQAEYDDPLNRRYHAQPNACPACGPHLSWSIPDSPGARMEGDAALEAAVEALRLGHIVAVKGVGGFHLAVDATKGAAVAELRRRKHRDDKPFAVMVTNIAVARELCELSDAAESMLTSVARPIVIARQANLGACAAPAKRALSVTDLVAPGSSELGLILPYTPLHHLLLERVGRPLVMTSGNLSDEPIAHEDADAIRRLSPLVDGVLGHDRPIHIRCDDSVVRANRVGGTQVLRRSRGFAPQPLALPIPARHTILAVGAQLKSTVALTLGRDVVASHHLGDLEHLATYQSFRQAIDYLLRIYEVTPELVAHDLHPEYLSTKFAQDLDLPLLGVQHHHAHIASCLTEHQRTDAVLGLAFDGTGYGSDGTLWGGELLIADLAGFQRVGHLAPATMPGGAAAIREPWRMGVAWTQLAGVDDPFDDPSAGAIRSMAARGQGPITTSIGRLFDAVAALLGLHPAVSYEAQAAIELEALALSIPLEEAPTYPVAINRDDAGLSVIDPAPLIAALLDAYAGGEPVNRLAAGFHRSIGTTFAEAATELASQHKLDTVALSGGVFQNVRLSQIIRTQLQAAGLTVLEHHEIPPNDGGISIGQAAIAAATT